MPEPTTAAASAVRAAPLLARLARSSPPGIFLLPPAGWLLLAAGFLIVGAAAALTIDPLALAPAAVLVIVCAGAIVAWVWVARPAGNQDVVFVSQFSERSTDGRVRVSAVHRQELVSRVADHALLGRAVSTRKLPILSERAAARVLRHSGGLGVVRGESVVAANHVKWNAQLVYRVLAHSRSSVTTDDGRPGALLGEAAWTRAQFLKLRADGRVPIEILTDVDFPATHADGVVVMLLALRALRTADPDELGQLIGEIRARWSAAPAPAKAIVLTVETDTLVESKGWYGARASLLDALRQDAADDPLFHFHVAGYVAIACSHGLETPETWLQATERLPVVAPTDPRAMYMRVCALMGASRWEEALTLLAGLARERFGGVLGPTRSEVLAAYYQAADLAADSAHLELARLKLRRALRPGRFRRRPPADIVPYVAWLTPHSYDGVAMDAMQRRLNALGRDVQVRQLRDAFEEAGAVGLGD